MHRSSLALALTVAALAAALPVSVATAAARPDLQVAYISEPPSALQPGDQFTATLQIHNAGTAAARATTTRFYLSQDKRLERSEAVGRRAAHRLRPGSRSLSYLRIAVPSAIDTGDAYFLFACLDSTRRVRESNERNNCIGSATLLLVRPKP